MTDQRLQTLLYYFNQEPPSNRGLQFRFQLCGLEEEGVPDIIFMMRDDVAVGVFSQMSGHGSDNTFPKMYGHVRVSGPAFKKVPDVEKKPVIMNTEMYNLFCSVLGRALTPIHGEIKFKFYFQFKM